MTTQNETSLRFKGTDMQRQCKFLQDTAHKPRLSGSAKTAIMTLSRSFDKKHLGKQQQLLQEITLRCRQQEVADLSGSITKKVSLNGADMSLAREVKKCALEGAKHKEHKEDSMHCAECVPGANPSEVPEGLMALPAGILPSSASTPLSLTRSSTEFPQRRVLKSPRKEYHMILPRLNISYRKGVTPSDPAGHHREVALTAQQQGSGQIQLRPSLPQRPDHLAPLILPSIQYVGTDENNVSAYMHTKRINITVATPRSGKAQIRITARTKSDL